MTVSYWTVAAVALWIATAWLALQTAFAYSDAEASHE